MSSDYGLCIQDCTTCEFRRSYGCGLNYDGEPYPTEKELLVFICLVLSPIIIAILWEAVF